MKEWSTYNQYFDFRGYRQHLDANDPLPNNPIIR